MSLLVGRSGREQTLVYGGALLVAGAAGMAVAYSQSFLGDKGPFILVGALLAVAISGAILLQWRLGALLLIAVLPYESLITFGSVASGNKLIALLTFSSLGLALLRDEALRERLSEMLRQPLFVAVLAFVGWVMLSMLWATDKGAASGRIVTFLGVFGLMVVIGLLERRYLTLAWALAVFGTALSVPAAYVLPQEGKMETAGRFGTAGADPNSYACLLAILFFIGYFGLLSRHRAVAYLLAPVFLYGIFATQSRTGLLVLAAVPLVAALVPRLTARMGARTLLMYALAAAAFAAIIVAVPSVSEGMTERYSELSEADSEEAWAGRWSIWQGAYQIIISHPFAGVGVGNFAEFAIQHSEYIAEKSADVGEVFGVAHNMFLGVASELGLVGLALFVTVLFLAFRLGLPLANRSNLGLGLFLGLIAFVIAGMTLTWEYSNIGYVLFGSLLSLQLQGVGQEKSEDDGEAS